MSDLPPAEGEARPAFDWPRFRSVLGALISAATVTAPLYVAAKILVLADGDIGTAAVIVTYTDAPRLALSALVYWVPAFGLVALVSFPNFFRNRVGAYQWTAFLTMSAVAASYVTGNLPSRAPWLFAIIYGLTAFVLPMAIHDIHAAMIREDKSFWVLARDTFTRGRWHPKPAKGSRPSALDVVKIVVTGIVVLVFSSATTWGILSFSVQSPPTKWIAFDDAEALQPVSWTAAGDGGTYYLLRDAPADGERTKWHVGEPVTMIFCEIEPKFVDGGFTCGDDQASELSSPSPSAGSTPSTPSPSAG